MKDKGNYITVRDKSVVKANDLIQKSRFSLSLLQQKIVLYLISQITAFDTDFKEYEFDIREFCQVCGIDFDNGGNYGYLKEQIKAIADKSLWIKIQDEETLLRWIEKPYINKKNGTIRIRLDDNTVTNFILIVAVVSVYFVTGLVLSSVILLYTSWAEGSFFFEFTFEPLLFKFILPEEDVLFDTVELLDKFVVLPIL